MVLIDLSFWQFDLEAVHIINNMTEYNKIIILKNDEGGLKKNSSNNSNNSNTTNKERRSVGATLSIISRIPVVLCVQVLCASMSLRLWRKQLNLREENSRKVRF